MGTGNADAISTAVRFKNKHALRILLRSEIIYKDQDEMNDLIQYSDDAKISSILNEYIEKEEYREEEPKINEWIDRRYID
jgi:formylmethanofuran dehydrogenase subunit E